MIVGLFVLVWLLLPTILERSPLGDVVRESAYAEAKKTMQDVSTEVARLLADAGVESLADLFDDGAFYRETVEETVAHHTDVMYALLAKGRNADVGMKPALRRKLSEGYGRFALGEDPWDNRYRFYAGPWVAGRHAGHDTPPFLSYVDGIRKPVPEGFRPSGDEQVILFTFGPDGVSSQPYHAEYDANGAGDDVGSWASR